MSTTYVVTGCNRGLGLEFARQLAARGDRVIATARRPDEAGELAALAVETHALDVADPDNVRELAAAIAGNPVDVLVNNAGIGVRSRPFEQFDLDGMARFFEVNAIAPLRLARALLPNLRSGGQRKVINITSRMGSIADNSSGGAYGYRTSKAALNMATRSMAIDLEPEGFICVVLHPGWVRTDMGGAGAPVLPEDSIAGMLRVIDGLTPDNSGSFFDFTGEKVPW